MRLSFIAFLFSTVSFCQVYTIKNLEDIFTIKNLTDIENLDKTKKIEGSPFIKINFEKVIIEGNEFTGRYNAFSDYFELDKNGQKRYFNPSKKYRFDVIFKDKNVLYKSFYNHNLGRNSFYKVLSEKNQSFLLCKESIKYIPEKKPKNSYESYKAARFSRNKDKYFILFDKSENIKEIPTRKSKFFKMFESKKANKIKIYIKENQKNIKKESDLVDIFNYYLTL